MNAQHLPSNEDVLARLEPWTGTVPAGYIPTLFGARTAVIFCAHWLQRDEIAEALSGSRQITHFVPAFCNGEMFFEQANIARSILLQRPTGHDRFIVVELGGGYGPRAVDSALALRQLRPDLTPFLVVVEALPTYVDWCRQHFIANELHPDEHWIIPGIVAAEPIPALFNLRPNGFGNQIADAGVMETLGKVITDREAALALLGRLSQGSVYVKDDDHLGRKSWRRRNAKIVDGGRRTKSFLGDPNSWTCDAAMETVRYPPSISEFGFVSALTLPTILAPLPYVDFMDVDIQFAEADVIPPHLDLLKKKVRLLSIGTHSKEIHSTLYRCFESAGWRVVNDLEPWAHHVRGVESFDTKDGILTVQNPNVNYDPLDFFRKHNNSVVKKIASPSIQIAVETEEERWAYAVSFRLHVPPSLDGFGELGVTVDLEVQVGEIGIACTTADFSSFVDREVFVSSGMRRRVVVPIGAPGAASHLMFRNANPRGRSITHIHGVELCREASAEYQ